MRDAADIHRLVGGALLGSGSDAIVFADPQGLIRLWNPGAERIFGYTSEEALGRDLAIIIPERLRERHWTGYQQAMLAQSTRYAAGDLLAVPAVRKDGTTLSIEFTIVLCRNQRDELVGIVATIRDVTARFEEMRALRKAASATR